MSMYAKLMARITESSLMEEDILVRYTFIMLLAIADPQGYVIGTDVAIARRLNLPIPELKAAITELGKPDPDSNSQEMEGRRVIESDCERGYFIVNYRKYRETRDEEQRREYMRDYMRKRRGHNDVAPVNSGKLCKPQLADGEGEGKGEEETPKSPKGTTRPRRAVQTDDEWMESLQGNVAYQHVNVRAEAGKAKAWTEVNNREFTRRFFMNWLNKAASSSRPMSIHPSGAKTTTTAAKRPDRFEDPMQKELDNFFANGGQQ